MAPYRTGRIYDLLLQRQNLRPADCITIQTDLVSPPHRQIEEQLLAAGERVRALDPRARVMMEMLPAWNGLAAVDSAQMSFLEFTRRALLWHLLRPRVGAAAGLYQWQRSSVFLENVLREHPARWLPPEFRSYDELLMTSADLAVQQMELESHRAEPSAWEWGTFSQLRIFHPLGQHGFLRRQLSIGPLGISGSLFSVKQVTPTFAPSMRYVADLGNFDNSLMNITVGESGQYLSPHYRDQFPSWYEGKGISAEFSDALVGHSTVHRLRLRPAP
jgi:penicillin amidase